MANKTSSKAVANGKAIAPTSKVALGAATTPTLTQAAALVAAPTKTTCQFCGKTITRTGTVTAGHGARCAAVQAHFANTAKLTPAQYKAKYTLAGVPPGYIKTAVLHKLIVRAQHAGRAQGANVSKMVRAFGTDKGILPLLAPIWRFFYVGRARYVNAWCATPAAFASLGAYQPATDTPQAPTLAHLRKVASGKATPAYKVLPVPTLEAQPQPQPPPYPLWALR